MDTQHDGEASVRFDRPPVQLVQLTVFFETIEGLQVSHFSALREAWRADYPDTAELPPLRPHNRGGQEAALFPIGQAWPFPHLMLSTEDDRGTIAIQNDRFIRTWAFTPKAGDYPGYEQLSADLEARLAEVAAHVLAETGQEIVLTGASCDYENKIEGYSPEQMFIGLATRWSQELESPPLRATYAGVRLHTCTEDDMNGCFVNLALDIDDDGCFLNFGSQRNLKPDDGDLRLGGLDVAHEQLLRKFVEFTSPAMHKEWRRL